MRLTNNSSIPLGLAVWLATDEYDYDDRPNVISVTTLLKPVRQMILGRRVAVREDSSVDLMDLVAGARGDALHKAIENAWKHNHKDAMKLLGYPAGLISKVEVNPVTPSPGSFTVYLEQRHEREIDGWIVTGKYDMVLNGQVTDNKSTSTYTYTKGTSEDKWQLQGSMYRWLTPERITDANLAINWVFVDWKRNLVGRTANYPESPILGSLIPLLSLNQTEAYIRTRLSLIDQYKDAPEATLPECTDEDLWRDPPQFKYYANPEKMGRATKNFDTHAEALQEQSNRGKGIIKTVLGLPKACNYCPGRAICSQYTRMFSPENS